LTSEIFGAARQVFFGAVGGALPFLIQIVRRGAADMSVDLPHIGTLYVVAILVSLPLGALSSYAFKAHNVLTALYHGATAPLTLAFLTGIDTHVR
jgi:hypothetical protein